MFGPSRPIVIESYGRRRSRWRLPRWALLLLAGLGAGAAAVVVVQERYLPPRLSANASAALQQSYEQADVERARLRGELGETRRRLDAALSATQSATDELAAARAAGGRLRDDLASVVAHLPADPRGGAVAVRAARFTPQGGALGYDIVLTREQAVGKPLPGTLQLVVAGESARGVASTVAARPIALSLGRHEVLRGSLPLPDGFRPRQTTVQVLDGPAGRPLGKRVLNVN